MENEKSGFSIVYSHVFLDEDARHFIHATESDFNQCHSPFTTKMEGHRPLGVTGPFGPTTTKDFEYLYFVPQSTCEFGGNAETEIRTDVLYR